MLNKFVQFWVVQVASQVVAQQFDDANVMLQAAKGAKPANTVSIDSSKFDPPPHGKKFPWVITGRRGSEQCPSGSVPLDASRCPFYAEAVGASFHLRSHRKYPPGCSRRYEAVTFNTNPQGVAKRNRRVVCELVDLPHVENVPVVAQQVTVKLANHSLAVQLGQDSEGNVFASCNGSEMTYMDVKEGRFYSNGQVFDLRSSDAHVAQMADSNISGDGIDMIVEEGDHRVEVEVANSSAGLQALVGGNSFEFVEDGFASETTMSFNSGTSLLQQSEVFLPHHLFQRRRQPQQTWSQSGGGLAVAGILGWVSAEGLGIMPFAAGSVAAIASSAAAMGLAALSMMILFVFLVLAIGAGIFKGLKMLANALGFVQMDSVVPSAEFMPAALVIEFCSIINCAMAGPGLSPQLLKHVQSMVP